MTADQLVNQLYRPIYVLQMARPREHEDSPFGRGAHKRAEQARAEIDQIVAEYVVRVALNG